MLYRRHLHDVNRVMFQLLSTPVIFSVIIPLIVLDLWVEFYHRICFVLYGIEYVDRSRYIKIWDRTKLDYLQGFDKVQCAYCGYANGLLAYVSEIAARTEIYWCGIKHENDPNFIPPPHHEKFAEYGDKRDFYKKYEN